MVGGIISGIGSVTGLSNIISGIKSLFNSLSLIITGVVYPLIPRLYSLFMWLSQYQFLDIKIVHRIWSNIYVFVAIIVLFAIAIRLISAMVNPDTFSDNKKGIKNYYFRAVFAVVMIFIVPILFEYSFDIQKDLLDNNFLTTSVLGYKVKEGTDVGQALAWEVFSSFCTPLENDAEVFVDGKLAKITVKPDAIQKNAYILAQQNMDYLPGFTNVMRRANTTLSTLGSINPTIRDNSQLEYGYRYHEILCPLAGGLIAYELFLLCMDTMFRAMKLGFLELMLPIILGAYVFNPEILKKWAKEFFSTYITLFIKVLAIGLMIFAFASSKELMSKDDAFFNDWLRGGIFRLLFIIALLQLIKKVPDLINSIFGTNIKLGGGIKGRLGEMAGIGGLAQKAWSSLGNIAKNTGKLIAQAPLAVGYVAADRAYYRRHGDHLKNAPWFKQGKGMFFGARAAFKSGSLAEGVQAYDQQQAMAALTTRDAYRLRNRNNEIAGRHNYTAAGYQSRNPVTGEWTPLPQQIADKNGYIDEMTATFHGRNAKEADRYVRQLSAAGETRSLMTTQQKARDDLLNNLAGYKSKVETGLMTGKLSQEAANFYDSFLAEQNRRTEVSFADLEKLATYGIANESELANTSDLVGKFEAGAAEAHRRGYKEDEVRKKATLGTAASMAEGDVKTYQEQLKALADDPNTPLDMKQSILEMIDHLDGYNAGFGGAIQSGIHDGTGTKISYEGDKAWLATPDTRGAAVGKIYSDIDAANEAAEAQRKLEEEAEANRKAEEERLANIARNQSIQNLINAAQAELDALNEEYKNANRHGVISAMDRLRPQIAAKEAEINNLKSQLKS